MTIPANSRSLANFGYRVKNNAALAGCAAATIIFSAFLINCYLLNPGESDIVKFFKMKEIQIGLGFAGAVILNALLSYGFFGKKMRPEDEKAVANAALTLAHKEALRIKDRNHQIDLDNTKHLLTTANRRDKKFIEGEKDKLQTRLNTANRLIFTLQRELESEKTGRATDAAAHATALSNKDTELANSRTQSTTDLASKNTEILQLTSELSKIAEQRSKAHALISGINARNTPPHTVPDPTAHTK